MIDERNSFGTTVLHLITHRECRQLVRDEKVGLKSEVNIVSFNYVLFSLTCSTVLCLTYQIILEVKLSQDGKKSKAFDIIIDHRIKKITWQYV